MTVARCRSLDSCCSFAIVLHTHFRNILRKVFSFELSSGALSDTYESGLDIVVASVVEAVEVVVLIEGVGDAWALFVDESGDGVVVMLAEYM